MSSAAGATEALPQRPRRPQRLLHTKVAATGDLLVLDPLTDKTTVLNAVAGAVWLLCDGANGVEDICAALADFAADSGVPPAQLRSDVEEVLLEFRRADLIET